MAEFEVHGQHDHALSTPRKKSEASDHSAQDNQGRDKLLAEAERYTKERVQALVQVAIALTALTVLTRQQWMLLLSGVSAAWGVAFWILARM